ncbi:hypothetical protein H8356DRAFT_1273448 [Neocallimastix lanati (nom. inval.)]|nr:hypothetical protein H8356DRAFT_1273448 [Neocallimastix sp. JGI-2020a]
MKLVIKLNAATLNQRIWRRRQISRGQKIRPFADSYITRRSLHYNIRGKQARIGDLNCEDDNSSIPDITIHSTPQDYYDPSPEYEAVYISELPTYSETFANENLTPYDNSLRLYDGTNRTKN